MATENKKPISEWSVDELFAEMEDFFNYLGKGGEFRAYIIVVFKEIILRVGPPYEIYEKFGQLQSLLAQIEDLGETDSEFENLVNQAIVIWEEIKDWYLE